MFYFFNNKPQKEKLEPKLYIDKPVNGFTDEEIRVLTTISMRTSAQYNEEQDHITQDFIFGINGYEEVTFEQKISYLLVTMGNLFVSENTKRKVNFITDRLKEKQS